VEYDDPLQGPDDYKLALYCRQPPLVLVKDGPATAANGLTIPLTLSISSQAGFLGDALLTDTLPAGMSYAGNLTWTHGTAWQQGGTVHWTNVPTEVMPAQVTIGFQVVVSGSGGEVIHNTALLDWEADGTQDSHQVTIEEALPVFYLPLVYKGW
jgi:hypothetical protein